jgi:hypothetical protein
MEASCGARGAGIELLTSLLGEAHLTQTQKTSVYLGNILSWLSSAPSKVFLKHKLLQNLKIFTLLLVSLPGCPCPCECVQVCTCMQARGWHQVSSLTVLPSASV